MIIELQVEKNLSLSAGLDIVLIHDANNKIFGTVESYDKDFGALKVKVTKTLGSGTFKTWTIHLAAASGVVSTGSQQGLMGPQGKQGPKGDKGNEGEQGARGVAGGVTFEVSSSEFGSVGKSYIFDNAGISNPEIYFIRGFTYYFDQKLVTNSNEKMFISTTLVSPENNRFHSNGVDLFTYSGTAGVDGLLTIEVPKNAPDVLYYASETTSGMVGKITIDNVGPKGDVGDIGLTGADGVAGERGQQGMDGPRGSSGTQGIQGERGQVGRQGPGGEGGTVGISSGGISSGSEKKDQAFNLFNSEIDISGETLSASDIDYVGAVVAEPMKLTSFRIYLRGNTLGSVEPANKAIDIRIYKNGIDSKIGTRLTSSSLIGLIDMKNDDPSKHAELSVNTGDRISVYVSATSVSGSSNVSFNYLSAISVIGSKGDQGSQGEKGETGAQGVVGSVNKEEMIKYVLIFG